MSSTSGKEQFMKQFDAIVEGIKQNKVKVSTSEHKTNSSVSSCGACGHSDQVVF
jgi:hypothetical protein